MINRKNKKARVNIWDSIGQERYRSITKGMYNNTDGIILLYDITEKESFEKITGWITDIKKSIFDDTVIILVGHKADLENKRKISINEGNEFALKNNIPFFEASAKTNLNIEDIFNKVIDLVIDQQENDKLQKKERKPIFMELSGVKKPSPSKSKKGCC